MTETNLRIVESADNFKELMSADLNRVAVVNFWAPWVESCKRMNEFIALDLSKKHPHVLFLQVEAEVQSDVAESFDIEAVPAFIILKGHTLLERIAGADQAALTASVEKHGRIVDKPLSHTDKAPAKAAITTPATIPSEETKTETKEELNARLRKLMNQDKVVLFMKGSPDAPRCGFSRKIVTLLGDQKVNFTHFDILTDESVRQGLKVLNDWPTFPQLIINGELVGGLDIVKEMAETGDLQDALKD